MFAFGEFNRVRLGKHPGTWRTVKRGGSCGGKVWECSGFRGRVLHQLWPQQEYGTAGVDDCKFVGFYAFFGYFYTVNKGSVSGTGIGDFNALFGAFNAAMFP